MKFFRNIRNKVRQVGQSNRRGPVRFLQNRFRKPTPHLRPNGQQYMTVTGLPVFVSGSGNNLVTANGTRLTSYQNKNAPGGIAFTSGNKVSNNGYYGGRVFANKGGAYYSGSGKGLFKHRNGKFYNYMN